MTATPTSHRAKGQAMSKLEPWQERLIAEKAKLDEDAAKNAAFQETPQYGALPWEDRQLLLDQLHAQHYLSAILAKRIARFK